jgi:splicing factor 3A subunit 1
MDEEDGDLKIVSNYQPRIGGSQNVTSNMTMLDPISGKMIAIEKMEEHMRVQLLDPKWREEQKRFQDKQKDSGYAEGGSIADSLKLFARKRGDIFGQATTGSGPNTAAAIASEEQVEQARYEDSVQWDGHHGSIGSAQSQKINQTQSFASRGLLPQAPTNLPPAIGPSATAPVVVPVPVPAPYAFLQPQVVPVVEAPNAAMLQYEAYGAFGIHYCCCILF